MNKSELIRYSNISNKNGKNTIKNNSNKSNNQNNNVNYSTIDPNQEIRIHDNFTSNKNSKGWDFNLKIFIKYKFFIYFLFKIDKLIGNTTDSSI